MVDINASLQQPAMNEANYAEEREELKNHSFLWLVVEKELRAMVERAEPLEEILKSACLSVEALISEARCAILLLDQSGSRFIGGIAPSLPAAFLEEIKGIPVGSQVSPSSAACWMREPVVIDDIRLHPLCTDYRTMESAFDFRSSCSIPVMDPDGKVLGCYAVYFGRPNQSPPFFLEALTALVRIVGIAVQASRGDNSRILRDSDYRLMVDALAEGVMLRSEGKLIYVNQSAARILGAPVDKLMGSRPSSDKVTFVDPDGRPLAPEQWPSNRALKANEIVREEVMGILRKSDRSVTWVVVSCQTLPNQTEGREPTVMISLEDITEVREAQRRIAFLANHDSLTNLLNRVAFDDLLTRALQRVATEQASFALLYIDLDRFKTINDSLGHHRGDDVLRQVAERLVRTLGERGCVARWGGDEFVAMVEPCPERAALAAIVTELITQVSAPITIDAYEMAPGASIGIAIAPADGADAPTLLRHADAAMYEAKAQGSGGYCFFHQALSDRLERRTRLERAMHGAVERNELRLLYQPILDAQTSRMVGVEALLRWHSAVLGPVMPAEFIPVAEESEQIVLIGMWTLRTALRQAAAWHKTDPTLRMAINLSAKQFLWPGLVPFVEAQLLESGARADTIDFELTESLLLNESSSLHATFAQLKELGISLSIDDFGTGYSSLAYLLRFPIGTLKIDRGFIQGVPETCESVAIAEAIIAMAHAIGIRTVAEGVENQAQLDFLKGGGCDEFQGYLIARPLPADEIEARLAQLLTAR
jgi:diguanylate cyclase (GGDEF)-like protein/PAS domain S-box-containing protein